MNTNSRAWLRIACAVLLFSAGAGASADQLGAIGDSISTAMDADDHCDGTVDCLKNLGEDPDWSFVTGDRRWTIRSRLAYFGFSSGSAQTAAVNGASWEDALVQAQALTAVPGVSLVVIELGGNDVCQRLGEPPPDLDTIAADVDATLTHLTDALPSGGLVVVAEVPNVQRLRDRMRDQPHFLFGTCQALWDLDYRAIGEVAVDSVCADLYGARLCKAVPLFREFSRQWLGDWFDWAFSSVFDDEFPCANVLNSASSTEARAAAAEFNRQLNTLLARKALDYDGRNDVSVVMAEGIYDYMYSAQEVSGLDCFHPSRAGQAFFANLIWPVIYDALTSPEEAGAAPAP